MITLKDFYRAYQTFRPEPDGEQSQAIEAGPQQGVFIVAGPGSGKTTCLTLRILKLILVDDVPPRGILATTFTKKAAAELRSRILGWGFRLIEVLESDTKLPKSVRERIAKVDINQVVTGTIDSICEEILREHRDPGTVPPVLADDYVSKTLMLREGLFAGKRHEDDDLDSFLLGIRGGSSWGWHVGTKNSLIHEIWERRFQDQVEWAKFIRSGPKGQRKARKVLDEVLTAYGNALAGRDMLDFALLEQEVLNRFRAGQLTDFLDQIKVVLVDEYQDTNLLQESLYFMIAKACGGALTVVGDDDQSLYRFRGATVELFSEFSVRYYKSFKRRPEEVFLKTNYRSTQTIVEFVNGYAGLDKAYQDVRVKSKPELTYPDDADTGISVLGLFRDDVETLASALASFIHQIFRGSGYTLPDKTRIKRYADGGDLGDCALLCSSPAEYNASDKPRLPLLIRQELGTKGLEVFNPRGQDLSRIPLIARFGGLLLECLDPGGAVESQTSGLTDDITDTFVDWRTEGIAFAESKDAPKGLREFATGWVDRDPKRSGWQWPKDVPVLELIYGLVHFFPELYDDPEGQIYLEVFTRQASASEQVGSFSSRVVTDPDNSGLSGASVKELLRDFLGPIAAGAVDVKEELMDAFPRDRLSILSVHQAKGLEFPLTIVDVGSDFKNNNAAHAFKRFPRDGNISHALEDLLRYHTTLGPPSRSEVDRAFDDLFRQFFVAYSRPQEILMLVGLRKSLPGGTVRNVATGWIRTEVCKWTGKDLPFVEI